MLSSRIGLAPVPRFWREQALELAIQTRPAGNEAGGAVGRAARGAHVGDALAERHLTAAIRSRPRLAASASALRSSRPVLKQRDESEIDLALAQRLERLALVSCGSGPEASTGSVSSSTSMPRARAASSFGLDLSRRALAAR